MFPAFDIYNYINWKLTVIALPIVTKNATDNSTDLPSNTTDFTKFFDTSLRANITNITSNGIMTITYSKNISVQVNCSSLNNTEMKIELVKGYDTTLKT